MPRLIVDLLFVVGMLVVSALLIGIGPFVNWLDRRKLHLPGPGACVACGSTDLEILAPGVYVCRACGYQGGENRGTYDAAARRSSWAERPWPERIAAARRDLEATLNEIAAFGDDPGTTDLRPKDVDDDKATRRLTDASTDYGFDPQVSVPMGLGGIGSSEAKTAALLSLRAAAEKVPDCGIPAPDDAYWSSDGDQRDVARLRQVATDALARLDAIEAEHRGDTAPATDVAADRAVAAPVLLATAGAHLGVILGGVGIIVIVWLVLVRRPRFEVDADDGAPPPDPNAPRCTACGSTELGFLAPGVYVCRACGYEGGEKRAVWERAQRKTQWAARPWPERIASARSDVQSALRQILALEPDARDFPTRTLIDRYAPDQNQDQGDDAYFAERSAREALVVAIRQAMAPVYTAAEAIPGIELPADDDPMWDKDKVKPIYDWVRGIATAAASRIAAAEAEGPPSAGGASQPAQE